MTVLMPTPRKVPRVLMRREPPSPFESGPGEFDLLSALRLVRRRLLTIVLVSALIVLAAVPMILRQKSVYHAESRLMVHAPLVSVLDTNTGTAAAALNTTSEMERLLSRRIAERVIRELHLEERAEFNPALRPGSWLDTARGALRGLIDSGKPATAAPAGIELIIPEYYRALDIGRDTGSDVIRIGFNSMDPELAAAVPNRLLDIYLDERRAGTRNDLDTAIGWIRQRVARQQERVDAARAAATRTREAAGVVSNDAQAEDIRSVADLSSRLADIARQRTDTATAISALGSGSDEAIARIDVPDSIGGLQRKLESRNKDLDSLLRTYGERSDQVVALRAELLKIKGDLDFEINRYLQAQRARLAAFDRQEHEAGQALADARARLSRSAMAQTELARLSRIADTEQTALDKLQEQERDLVAQAAVPAVEVEVLSAATLPLRPEGRGRLFYLLATMLASLSLGVTAAFVLEMMDKSVRSHEQLDGIANTMPAGLLPVLSERAGKNLPLVFGESEGGLFSESVRAMVMALKQANAGQLPGSVLVTSAHAGEGKTLVARSLAIELAATGRSVLLVDGDLRSGDLGSLMKSGIRTGLNEFLTGEAGLGDIIHHHSNSGIDFIARGAPSQRKRPDLAGLGEIAAMAKASGRLLIVDSAPILGSTDTAYLASMTEAALLVVQWGRTHRRSVELAAQRLEGLGGSETLVVVNKVDPRRHALYGFRDSEIFLR
ncbi:GumC family protein [Aquamicrobium soli]|uniref:GumC family protein n=1 Tax=Aquamicrobium soli TaxID=1811518 RepID=A0ABV7K5U1_9HYPH